MIKVLRGGEWEVIVTHGNEFQSGLPDLYCAHYVYSTRWVEIKNPLAYSFTPAQHKTFRALQAKGVGIWVITSAEPEELQKLFQPANWWKYLPEARVNVRVH